MTAHVGDDVMTTAGHEPMILARFARRCDIIRRSSHTRPIFVDIPSYL
jgi:hypothetical protein